MAMNSMLPPQVRGFSSWPAWRVFRFLAIWSAVLAVPRALVMNQPIASLDIIQTLGWMWGLVGDVFRWLGQATGWW